MPITLGVTAIKIITTIILNCAAGNVPRNHLRSKENFMVYSDKPWPGNYTVY